METHEVLKMQAQLEEIRQMVNTLTAVNWLPDEEGRIQSSLARIWDLSGEVQRRLAGPGLLAGYRGDALDQVGRICELINDCQGSPDDQQLAHIGYACDLAQDKINIYRHMANQSAQVDVLLGEAA